MTAPHRPQAGMPLALAELLFTLAAAMGCAVLHAAPVEGAEAARVIRLVLFGIVAVGAAIIAVIKARLRRSDYPWLWKASLAFLVVELVLLAALGGFLAGRIAAVVLWIAYQAAVIAIARRR